MKKTSTSIYSSHFTFQVQLPNNDNKEILNSVSSTNNIYFSPSRYSVNLKEYATLHSNLKMSRILQIMPIKVSISTYSHIKVNIKQPTILQLIQVLCAQVYTRGWSLHSALMSHKSTGLIFNPTSSLLNLI